MKIVFTFYSSYFALKAEKALKSVGISFETIPTPREFSSDCGVAICIDSKNKEASLAIFNNNNVEFEEIHVWNV
ncbi:MAG: DUF3343 domain-containing protein [Candidatus Riflebacteria bacterium]|nr:DUF3343 domain-containing protein [Candidatus Riflebacteria bacterium]